MERAFLGPLSSQTFAQMGYGVYEGGLSARRRIKPRGRLGSPHQGYDLSGGCRWIGLYNITCERLH